MEDLADNWLNSMRSRQAPIYDVLKGYQVTVAIQLGVQSYKEGRAMGFDPVARRVLTRPGRSRRVRAQGVVGSRRSRTPGPGRQQAVGGRR